MGRAQQARAHDGSGGGAAAGAHGRGHAMGLEILHPTLHALHLTGLLPLRVFLHLLFLLHLIQGHLARRLGGGPHQQRGDALDDREQHAPDHGVAAGGLPTAPRGEHAACKEAGCDGVPVVVFPSDVLQAAVEGREGSAPDREVAAQDRGPVPRAVHGASEPVALGRVPRPLHEVPDEASDSAHAERATQVLHDAIRAGLAPGIAIACLPPRHGKTAGRASSPRPPAEGGGEGAPAGRGGSRGGGAVLTEPRA
mmetsp:Transcript_13755/g.35315  ORF Transcript_13755/g.35315 Transcript_13755/m.35315 type:complete len:253 (-) Transcript_13755:3-761(-)